MSGDAGGGHRYPDSEDEEAAMHAEVHGRKHRMTAWKIREAHPKEALPDDPRRYMLEMAFLGSRRVQAVTEADLRALNLVTAQFLMGRLPAADEGATA